MSQSVRLILHAFLHAKHTVAVSLLESQTLGLQQITKSDVYFVHDIACLSSTAHTPAVYVKQFTDLFFTSETLAA